MVDILEDLLHHKIENGDAMPDPHVNILRFAAQATLGI